MSAAHLEQVEHLIVLCRQTLDGVRDGQTPDLDAFGTDFDSAFLQLQRLGDVNPGESETPNVRRRLRDLEQVRIQLSEELGLLRSEMEGRLVGVSKGRKGIRGYKKTLAGSQRGALRGQG